MEISHVKTVFVIALLGFAGCSGTNSTPAAKSDTDKKEPVAPEPVTGKTAFWAVYKPAHAWAADLLPLTLEAKDMTGVESAGGKALLWEATFGSPSRHEVRKLTYAVDSRPPDIRKGVSIGGPLPWSGPTHEAMTFQTAQFVVDSDAAYQTAAAAAASWLSKHPGKTLTTLSLGDASRFPGPVWYFLWGDKKSGFFLLVNATTGKALAK